MIDYTVPLVLNMQPLHAGDQSTKAPTRIQTGKIQWPLKHFASGHSRGTLRFAPRPALVQSFFCWQRNFLAEIAFRSFSEPSGGKALPLGVCYEFP